MAGTREELRGFEVRVGVYAADCCGELAGWQELHARLGRRCVRGFVEGMVVREKERLEGMRRAVRGLGLG